MEPVNTEKTSFTMSDALYEKLKFIALVLLPALSTLYFTLGSLWGFSYVEQVVGTIAAIDTFLGVILRISTKSYNASPDKYVGAIRVTTKDDGVRNYRLEMNNDPALMEDKKEVTFQMIVE